MKITITKNSTITLRGERLPVGTVVTINEKGELHSENDEPAVVYPDGNDKRWYQKGLLHRDSGPAITKGIEKCWYRRGKLHREDGPARIGDNHQEWHYQGTQFVWNNSVCVQPYSPHNISATVQRLTLKYRPDLIDQMLFIEKRLVPEVQEVLIQKYPDQISEIQNLDPALKVKYQHESELAKVDL